MLRLMLDAPVSEGTAGFALPSPSTGPPSDVILDDLQQPLKELRVTLNVPSVDSEQAFSDARLATKTGNALQNPALLTSQARFENWF